MLVLKTIHLPETSYQSNCEISIGTFGVAKLWNFAWRNIWKE